MKDVVSTESEKVEGRLNRILKSSQEKDTYIWHQNGRSKQWKNTEGHFYRYDKGNVEYEKTLA